MESTAAGAAVARGVVPLPISSSSQPSRKEWRAVSEQLARNAANEDLERSKLGQCDERLIYEHGGEPVNVDFCSIAFEIGLDGSILQQRLQTVAKQRDELQQLEFELRGQIIARSKMSDMQTTFDDQIQEHVNANIKLQEKLHDMEQKIHKLENMMDEKNRELHAIRLDNEAAWAKDDLLREQNKELQTYRRERDNSEAERLQHIKQIHDLQEHIQEKERQFLEMQDQHRISQETIAFNEDQLREAQAWMTRAREMDVLQSTTNHSLQAELYERTEQCNQMWLGCQRQFGEMERLQRHIQQLQLELSDARERNGSCLDGPQVLKASSNEASQLGLSNGRQVEACGSPGQNYGSLENGNSENSVSLDAGGNTQADHAQGVLFSPSSLLGMPTYPPTGQMAALHPFVIHPQGLPHPQTQSHFLSMPAISTNHLALSDIQHAATHQSQKTPKALMGTDSHFDYEAPGNGQVHLDDNITQRLHSESGVPSSNEDAQVLNSIEKSYNGAQSQQVLPQNSSKFHDVLGPSPLCQDNGTKENVSSIIDLGVENRNMMTEPCNPISSGTSNATSRSILTDGFVQKVNVVGQDGEAYLLDERQLLACIVRTIGSGGRIRISSTLPNRLGKMLAPLHWHDYKKKYGKLEDFVGSHSELFTIEGEHILLREGAQETIAATAAVAKVAAVAAAAAAPSSPFLPSVTVTPLAESYRLKRIASFESSSLNGVHRPSNVVDVSNLKNATLGAGGMTNVRILSKPKERVEVTESETSAVLNGINTDKASFLQSKGASQGRISKQQSRAIGATSSPKR